MVKFEITQRKHKLKLLNLSLHLLTTLQEWPTFPGGKGAGGRSDKLGVVVRVHGRHPGWGEGLLGAPTAANRRAGPGRAW